MSRMQARTPDVHAPESTQDTGLHGISEEGGDSELGGSLQGNAFAQQQMNGRDGDPLDDGIAWGDNSQTARVRASTNKYTVVRGDTMSGIARRATQADYMPLYNLNRDRMPDQHTIRTGQVLVVPVGWNIPGMVADANNLEGDPLAMGANRSYTGPDLSLGTQVDAATGATTGAPADTVAATVPGARDVRIVNASSIRVARGGAAPAENQLFVEDPGGDHVTDTQGTVAAPNTLAWSEDSTMYINNAPVSADVRQGGIGDCYFLSTLLGLVEGDPGKVTSMMNYDGSRVTTTFQRFDAGAAAWVNCNVSCTNDLQVRADGTLHGAKMRVDDTPVYSDYSCDTSGGILTIDRDDYYEMALWAPLMEKCYARFAEEYGKYGLGAGTGAGGYNIIHGGGGSEDVYQIYYGGAATAFTETINYTQGSDLVTTNAAAIGQLVSYVNTQENPGAGGGTETFMHARIGRQSSARRLVQLIDAVVDDWWVWPWETNTLDPALNGAKTDINAWLAAPTAATRTTMLTSVRAVCAVGAHPELWDEDNGQEYRDLLEVGNIVCNIGTDAGPGTRSVYAAHAYHVKDVHFKGTDGADLALTTSNLAANIGNISDMESSVVLENPHARNEVDLDGDGPDLDSNNEGRFEMTLHSFLTNLDLLRGATVAHP